MRIDGVYQCALTGKEAPVSGLDAFQHHFQADSVPTKVVSSPSVVANLQKTRQFRPKRNRPQKRFSGFDTPSKCVSPNITRGFVKSAAQKTGEVQLFLREGDESPFGFAATFCKILVLYQNLPFGCENQFGALGSSNPYANLTKRAISATRRPATPFCHCPKSAGA